MKRKQDNNILKFFMYPFIGIYNVIKYILVAFYGVLYSIFSGLKFIIVDLFKILSYKLNNTVRKTKDKELRPVIKKEDNNSKKKKKVKVYNYSKRYLEKLNFKKQKLIYDLQHDGAIRSKLPNVYLYTAKNKEGKIVNGRFTGLSKLDVNAFLINEGYEVYDIQNNKLINFVFGESAIFSQKLSSKELIFWLTQLSTYLRSGLKLNDSIKILANQMGKNKDRQQAFQSVIYELTLGESFSSAMNKQGALFPALLINMVRAAEASGTLTETLEEMAEYYTEMDKTRKQMISALTYPSIITIFALAVVTFILVYVIPQFQGIYESSNAEIGGLTLAIINLSAFLQANWMTMIFIIVGVIVLYYAAYKKIKAFRATMQKFNMKLPVIGKVMIYNELTIFTKTFASLLKNNVFITDSMDILSRITNNEVYKEIMQKTIDNIINGEKISDAFKDHWAIPEEAYYMIVTGESTGELDNMMLKVSEYFQEMHRNLVSSLKSFIEPIMISGLALIVGVIILAVIVPMFDLTSQISAS